MGHTDTKPHIYGAQRPQTPHLWGPTTRKSLQTLNRTSVGLNDPKPTSMGLSDPKPHIYGAPRPQTPLQSPIPTSVGLNNPKPHIYGAQRPQTPNLWV